MDGSGTRFDPNKPSLLQASFNMLVNELLEQGYVSKVYTGMAGLVLEPTSGTDKRKIIVAMDNLEAGARLHVAQESLRLARLLVKNLNADEDKPAFIKNRYV